MIDVRDLDNTQKFILKCVAEGVESAVRELSQISESSLELAIKLGKNKNDAHQLLESMIQESIG